ncbi:NEBL protein [Sesbania bispinosa]|nr:NEBL protein [Sesbania bispinosa]
MAEEAWAKAKLAVQLAFLIGGSAYKKGEGILNKKKGGIQIDFQNQIKFGKYKGFYTTNFRIKE